MEWREGQFDKLKRGEFVIMDKIFDRDAIAFKDVTSWIRANPFRRKKIRGYTRPVNVATYKELYDKIQYMWTLFPREGTKRYKHLIRMEEWYNKHKPKTAEAI